jgi:citrate synthase
LSKLSIHLPDSLHKQLSACARAQGTSIDQLVNAAIGEKLTALLGPGHLETRAKRASREKFLAALKTVPDVEPQEFDRLPNKARKSTAHCAKSQKSGNRSSAGG